MADQTTLGLGKIITTPQERDAIHIAVVPVEAGETFLEPGERITLDEKGKAVSATSADFLGVVDPFLEAGPKKGQKFWLWLIPGSITSLRHVWTHPAFEEEAGSLKKTYLSKRDSELWLRRFAGEMHIDFDLLVAAGSGAEVHQEMWEKEAYGEAYSNDGEYLHFNGKDAYGDIPEEFWLHVENLTGKKNLKRAKYFSCSC